MVATQSNMLALGTKAHSFSLLDTVTKKKIFFPDNSTSKGFLFAFICNHCPYVIHLKSHFPKLFNKWKFSGIDVFAISSNDSSKFPEDGPERMAIEANKLNFKFPYLYDEDQSVAKLYNAACTPDFFLYNEKKELFYRGQYDQSRPGNEISVSGSDLNNAVKLMLAGKASPPDQSPSLGCNIKWKT